MNNDYYQQQNTNTQYPTTRTQRRSQQRSVKNPKYVRMYNPKTNDTKDTKIGISWTTFFFGPFVPLFKRDWWGLLLYAIYIVLIFLIPIHGSQKYLFAILMFLWYNAIYVSTLYRQGYVPKTDRDWKVINNNSMAKYFIDQIDRKRNKNR